MRSTRGSEYRGDSRCATVSILKATSFRSVAVRLQEMGRYDSSLTRVVPVFNTLLSRDRSGASWLGPLLNLGSRRTLQGLELDPGSLLSEHPACWGTNEKRLAPPVSLLRWLVQNVSAPAHERLWGSPDVMEKRRKLAARDTATVAEALALLEQPLRDRAWYVLEGRSRPDVFLETESLIVVIEGKRTERAATEVTTWMPRRSQMLRHMDAAWEIRGAKRILGLMIVEGDAPNPTEPNSYWLAEANRQIDADSLRESLPHRSSEVRQQLASGFIGVTTWQAVCQALAIQWPPFQDAV